MDVADPRAHRDIPLISIPLQHAQPHPAQTTHRLGQLGPGGAGPVHGHQCVAQFAGQRAVVVRQGTEQAQIQTVGGHNFRFHRVGNPAFDGADKYRTGEDALRTQGMNGARAPGVGDPSGGHHRNPLYRVNDQRDDGEGPEGGTRQRAAFVKAGGDNITPEGEEFYRRSKPLLSQADDLLESFAPDRPIRGQLRVDMPIAFARLLVIPHLPDFYQAHPEVEIVLSSSDVRRDMLRDGLDCLLRVGDLEDGDYVARSLGEVALTTCASPGYLARYGAPATLEDLQSHLAVNWVNSSSRQIMPWRFQTPEGIRQIAIPGKLVLDNSEVFTAAGLAGLGMLQGMRFFLQPYIDSGQLVEVLPDFPAPRRPLSLLYPHRHLSHKVRVFADWLQGLVATLD